jgi:hypothetical protein
VTQGTAITARGCEHAPSPGNSTAIAPGSADNRICSTSGSFCFGRPRAAFPMSSAAARKPVLGGLHHEYSLTAACA